MSQREKCHGIIQNAILIGTPCTRNSSEWNKITQIVAGRIVNAYCRLFILNYNITKVIDT